MRMRGEPVKINGYVGKDYELVYDDTGKAIGKKDKDGNFIPYKARGRPRENDRSDGHTPAQKQKG